MNKLAPIPASQDSKLSRESFGDPFRKDVISHINQLIDEALGSFEVSRQRALVVGQALFEIKARLPHGSFENYIERNFPNISYPTANRWMAAAANIVRFLPPPDAIDIEAIPISVLLTTDDNHLSKDAQKYKQLLLDLNGNTTLRDAANGVFNEGDEAHRITRAVNGKTKGGKGETDRKDFPLFTAQKLNHLSSHLTHWPMMTAAQRTECGTIMRQAILGQRTTLTRAGKDKVFKFNLWPDDLCQVAVETLKEVLKLRKNA